MWLIIFILGFVGYFIAGYINSTSIEKTKPTRYYVSGAFVITFLYLICLANIYTSTIEFHSKRWKFRTEIRIESTNGIETKRDTVFILNPKK
jgi:hypothetical protein